MSQTIETVDPEGGMRTWLRGLGLSCGQRVFLDVAGTPAFPYVTVGLVDITEDISDAPLDVTLVQLDAWGANKPQARALYGELRASLRTLTAGVTLAAGTTMRGTPVIVPGTTYLPDEDGTARYIITAQLLISP
jgi:hypothetical protein